MRHGSLFSGIGGFDLAAEWMGWENKFHCEWNPFGQRILKHYWPNATSYEDITKTDFTIHRGNIDILTGGFPCQPYSSAGKRLGKEDERHLWPHMLRAISEIQPTWVVGENVRGLVNWNDGLVFHEVQSDLEAKGYEVQPFLIPAASVNAPHQRYRIWFIAYNAAYTNSNGLHQCNSNHEIITGERGINAFSHTYQSISNGNTTNTDCIRLEQYGKPRKIFNEERENAKGKEYQSSFSTETMGENVTNTSSKRCQKYKQFGINAEKDTEWRKMFPGSATKLHSNTNWSNFPTVSPLCAGDDGVSNRLDGITFSKWRKESIKAGGNAIVPQVAHNIFKAVQAYQDLFFDHTSKQS